MMSDQPRIPAPLCDVCQKLDLWKTTNREPAEYDLGTWNDVKRKAKKRPRCPFCILLYSYGNETGKASISWRDNRGGFSRSTHGDTLTFLNEDSKTAKSPIGYARVVQPCIDLTLIKKWIKLCETHHEETCTPNTAIIKSSEDDPGVKVLRVIDVEEWCIAEAMPGVRYLALGYVPGQAGPSSVRLQRQNLAELSTKNALVSLREGLPKTISDAIDLVRLIGERYLWVDSLCLIQDDENDMLDGISHMDLVYQGALLTVVAAHGDNSEGLPGLHPGSRDVDQKIIEVLPGIKMTYTGVVYDALSRGSHNGRGFTLQELVVSHRTLIFTNDCIYFLCRANCWGEDTIYDDFPSVINNQPRTPAPLCDVCQRLNLWKTADREVPEGAEYDLKPEFSLSAKYDLGTEYDLGTWEDVKRKAKKRPRCPFCVTVRLLEGTTYGFETGKASVTWRKDGTGFFSDTYDDTLTFLNEDSTAKSPIGYARAVRPYIDRTLIKNWIKLCETHHEETCTPKAAIIRSSEDDPGVKVLRVIDVEEWYIAEAMPGVRYLALSYVWGQAVPSIRLQRHNLAELSTKNALVSLREGLPKTISDAIDLVRLIGERYLWVDSLCLIQDDENDMLDGISHMDLVYQGALLTIIAAYGVNANGGLPGLHPGSREVDQKIVEILPGINMTYTGSVHDALRFSGSHSERGWTFQELVLSHRTLIFTRKRIYFCCRVNCWGEDTIYDEFPSVINRDGTRTIFVPDNNPQLLYSYNMTLSRYQGRALTKESDRIHGFTGILNFLSGQMRSGHLEGLFTASFDICLLSWSRDFPRRREGFPSWSWAGWCNFHHGYAGYCSSHEDANTWLQTMTYIVWYKRSPKTAKLELVWDLPSQIKHGKPETHHIGYRPTSHDPYGRTLDGSVENLRTRPDDELDAHRADIIREEMMKRNYHFLHFFAHVVIVPWFSGKIADWTTRRILGHDKDTEWGFVQLDDPNSKAIPGPHELVLLSKMGRDEALRFSKEKNYDEFFDDAVRSHRPFYWVMYIVWLGEGVVAERRGIGFLYQDCLQDLHDSEKVWKEIILV